jgi:hypothetical protein
MYCFLTDFCNYSLQIHCEVNGKAANKKDAATQPTEPSFAAEETVDYKV